MPRYSDAGHRVSSPYIYFYTYIHTHIYILAPHNHAHAGKSQQSLSETHSSVHALVLSFRTRAAVHLRELQISGPPPLGAAMPSVCNAPQLSLRELRQLNGNCALLNGNHAPCTMHFLNGKCALSRLSGNCALSKV